MYNKSSSTTSISHIQKNKRVGEKYKISQQHKETSVNTLIVVYAGTQQNTTPPPSSINVRQ